MPHAGAPGAAGSNRGDLVAHANDAVAHDVGPQPAAARQRGAHTRPRQLLEIRARWAVADADHHDAANSELPADQRVEVDTLGDEIAARFVLADRHVGVGCRDRFARDQRDLTATALARGELTALRGVAIALEADTRERAHLVVRVHRLAAGLGRVDTDESSAHLQFLL